METQRATRQEVEQKLGTSYSYLADALVALHQKCQTRNEIEQRDSLYRNDVGFSKRDAKVYSPMAELVEKGQILPLSMIDFLRHTNAKGRMRIAQYALQILDLMGS